jgi:hypothetical protein
VDRHRIDAAGILGVGRRDGRRRRGTSRVHARASCRSTDVFGAILKRRAAVSILGTTRAGSTSEPSVSAAPARPLVSWQGIPSSERNADVVRCVRVCSKVLVSVGNGGSQGDEAGELDEGVHSLRSCAVYFLSSVLCQRAVADGVCEEKTVMSTSDFTKGLNGRENATGMKT